MIIKGNGSCKRLLDDGRCPSCRSVLTKVVDSDGHEVADHKDCIVCGLKVNERKVSDNETR